MTGPLSVCSVPPGSRLGNMATEAVGVDPALAQILQGTLILLAAAVGVGGYLVQSRLKAKARAEEHRQSHSAELRRLELARVREKLDTFAGPLQISLSELTNLLFTTFIPTTARTLVFGSQRECEMHSHHLDQLTGGKVTEFFAEHSTLDVTEFLIRGERNLLPSFVGPEVESMVREHPESEIADVYFTTCRRILTVCRRASDLINRYAGHLFQLQTMEKYLADWPACRGAIQSRFLMLSQIMTFTTELADIVERKWAKGDYSLLYPRLNKFPLGGIMYCMKQAIAIRARETELGLEKHAKFDIAAVASRIRGEEEKEQTASSKYAS